MTKDIAVRPSYSPADTANARAWGIKQGYDIGSRGRVHAWLLAEWDRALRPSLVQPKATDGVGRGHHTGKRGGASTIKLASGITRTVSKVEAHSARMWALANGISVPTRGRLNTDVLQQWADAGAQMYREVKATVYYHKMNAITHKPYAKEHIGIVYSDMLGSGKPRMRDYWEALGIEGVPVRIVTDAMLINVTLSDTNELVYAWVSKSDSKAVVDTLLANVSINA